MLFLLGCLTVSVALGTILVLTRSTMPLDRCEIHLVLRDTPTYLPCRKILLARRIGKKRIIAETGAGQHGVATATVCARFGMECVIYMGSEDVRRQALNVFRIQMLGAKVIPRPNTGFCRHLTHYKGGPSKLRLLHAKRCCQ